MPTAPQRLLPWSLVALRIALGPFILFAARQNWPGPILIAALSAGVLSDIFDGIIARRLGVATSRLRQADSVADIIFWLFVLAAAVHRAPGIFASHAAIIIALLLAEATVQAVSMARFRRMVATHSYAAKAWGLALFLGFANILAAPSALPIMLVCAFGLAVEAEILGILFLARTYPVDTPSILPFLIRREGVGGTPAPD